MPLHICFYSRRDSKLRACQFWDLDRNAARNGRYRLVHARRREAPEQAGVRLQQRRVPRHTPADGWWQLSTIETPRRLK